MICPVCKSAASRRSKRRTLLDHLLSFFGMRPWRCKICETRFYAWLVPARYIFHVHCNHCGNLDLQRISREHIDHGWFLGLKRLLGFPAYRCAPCRHRFFSLRPYRRVIPTRTEAEVTETGVD